MQRSAERVEGTRVSTGESRDQRDETRETTTDSVKMRYKRASGYRGEITKNGQTKTWEREGI